MNHPLHSGTLTLSFAEPEKSESSHEPSNHQVK